MGSTPLATTSASPDSWVREAMAAASGPKPHSRSTVVAGMLTGGTAIRPTLRSSSPTPFGLKAGVSTEESRRSGSAPVTPHRTRRPAPDGRTPEPAAAL